MQMRGESAVVMPLVLMAVVDTAPHGVLADNLRREGLRVCEVAHGGSAPALAASQRPDLVVLDPNLSTSEGSPPCSRLPGQAEVPLILISAHGSEVDRVTGLELGADDYLVKPLSVRELVARARVVLRRAGRQTAGAAER